jgi:hypothetical protein
MQGGLFEKKHSAQQNEYLRPIPMQDKVKYSYCDGHEST